MVKARKSPPHGRLINAGQITLASGSDLLVDAKHRNRRETRQVTVEAYAQLRVEAAARGVEVVLPEPMASIILACAQAGALSGQGKSRPFKPLAERDAIEAALQEAPEIYERYLAQAKASGRFRNPRAWARQKAAADVRRRMLELGVTAPPSAASIMKRKMRP